ncbi:MAG: glycosyltransferase [Chlorobiaceae bacterium]|nr:glycosyltransferase [Chlorobiaceae bacterium]NTW64140.1 glycosyltransferase [Chlorobiaceae bacterium]
MSGNTTGTVSVVVVTYNSAPFVIDTLESVRRQTYPDIEMIVTDDCSRDDTVRICREWLAENKSRFSDVDVVVTPVNNGVPANCNRGMRRASGDWIKFIAGDDILLDDCIEQLVLFAETNPAACFISGGVIPFDEQGERKPIYASYKLKKRTSSLQFNALLRDNCSIPAPALFLKKSTLEAMGGFDERYSIVEDVPLYIKVTHQGYMFYFLDRPVVRYRSHQGSIMSASDHRHSDQVLQFSRDVVLPLLKKERKFLLYWHIRVMNYSIEKTKTRFLLIDNLLLRNLFWLAVDPLYWVVLFVKVKGYLLNRYKRATG